MAAGRPPVIASPYENWAICDPRRSASGRGPCDFYSVASGTEIPTWLQAVQRELLLYQERFHEFDSLHLGGGKPNMLGKREPGALMEWLFEHFAFCPESEMSIKTNPDGE